MGILDNLFGSSNQQTTQTTAPSKFAKPYIKKGMKEASRLFNKNKGFKPAPGSNKAVQFDPATLGAMGGIMKTAQAGNPLGKASMGGIQSILNSGGMTPEQHAAMAGTMGVATGANNINTGGQYQDLYNQGGPNTEGDLRSLLGQSNTDAWGRVVDTQSNKLADQINQSIGMSGRYGSAGASGALATQLGDFREKAMADQFNSNIANQRGILGDITGVQQQRFGNQMGALGGLTGVQGANIANMVGAGQAYDQAGNAATGNVLNAVQAAPGAYEQQYSPYTHMASVGAMNEDLATRQQQASQDYFNTQQQAPINRLNQYNAAIGGAGSLGGTTTGTVQAPSNFFGNMMGGAMMGGKLGMGIPGVGTGLGALGGGALGLGASLFG